MMSRCDSAIGHHVCVHTLICTENVEMSDSGLKIWPFFTSFDTKNQKLILFASFGMACNIIIFPSSNHEHCF